MCRLREDHFDQLSLGRAPLWLKLRNSVAPRIFLPGRAAGRSFLAAYARTTKNDIRHNCSNIAETLGFLGRILHGCEPKNVLEELSLRLGEAAEPEDR